MHINTCAQKVVAGPTFMLFNKLCEMFWVLTSKPSSAVVAQQTIHDMCSSCWICKEHA